MSLNKRKTPFKEKPMSKAPLYVAGTIFAVVALAHLYRFVDNYNVVFGTTPLPFWISGVGAVVAGLLSYWMFASTCEKCCK